MRLLGSGVLNIMSKKGLKLLPSHWEMVSFPFTLLRVTKSGSWPCLRGVRSEWFAHRSAFGLVSLGQPTWARADMVFSITPGSGTERSKKDWVWHRGATSKGCWGWFAPLPVAWEGKETSAPMQKGQEVEDGQRGDARRPHCPSRGRPGCSPTLPAAPLPLQSPFIPPAFAQECGV